MSPRFRVVIPARFASTRLPGKPLRAIAGKPMIEHVWDRALESGCAEALVATDDARILEAVRGFGGRAVMTRDDHVSGTDRLAEVARQAGWGADEIIVNLQGDEPGVPGALLGRLAAALERRAEAGIATLATPIREVSALLDPNVVKVVTDASGLALYFSRAPIPWVRGSLEWGGQLGELPSGVTFLRHIGLYAYRVGTLLRIADAQPASIERAESLEQLRAMAMGVRIDVGVIEEAPGHGVDTEADLERVDQLFRATAPRA